MSAPTAAQQGGQRPSFRPGHVIGGRFIVERTALHDAFGTVFFAKDQKTQKSIALRVISPALTTKPGAVDALRNEIKAAAGAVHRSITATYGVGSDGHGSQFVACEWVEGALLTDIIERRKVQAALLSVRGAYNVVAHVAKALTQAHTKTAHAHGAVRPGAVTVTPTGRVKLGDFGVARALLQTAGAGAFGIEAAFLAPEVKAGREPTLQSDVFGLGALLYAMLTGRSPNDAYVPPSKSHPDASPQIDAILMKCLAVDAKQRFATVDEVRVALLPLAASATAPMSAEFGVDMDIDVDLATSIPPVVRRDPSIQVDIDSGAFSVPPSAEVEIPKAAPLPVVAPGPAPPPRVSAPRMSAPQPPQPQMRAPQPAAEQADAERASQGDLQDLIAKMTANDAPRWMLVKGGLDHGPFTARELVQMILKGEALETDDVINMDERDRRRLTEFPDFVEFVDQYKIKKRALDEKAALARSAKIEKASAAGKFVILAGVIGVIAVGAGIYVLSLKKGTSKSRHDAELADLYERGQVKLSGTAGILSDPPRRSGGGGGRRAGGGGGGAGGQSYEEAMSQAVNLGDVTAGGSERRLTPQDVAGVMNRNLQSLYSCVGQELRRGGNLGHIQIDLAIAGSGQVLGASVGAGSAGFKECIGARVRRISFPSFPAPRMGARYAFDVN